MLTPHHDGSALDASAGDGGLQSSRPAALATGPSKRHIAIAIDRQRDLFEFVTKDAPHVRYPLISNNWRSLTSYLIYTDGEALPVGGFSRRAPTLSGAQFTDLVEDGQARFFLAGVGGGGPGAGREVQFDVTGPP